MFTTINAMHGHLYSEFVHAVSTLRYLNRSHGQYHDFNVQEEDGFCRFINEHVDEAVIRNVIFSYKIVLSGRAKSYIKHSYIQSPG